MGPIRELDLHRDQLGRLARGEVQLDVVHLGIEVRELHDVVHVCEAVGAVLVLGQGQPISEVDSLVAGAGEVVHIEDEHLAGSGQ